MPPKFRKAPNSDAIVEDSEDSFASVETASSAGTVTAEQLEKILEANHRSMAALISTLTSSSIVSDATPRIAPIKVPKWTDDEIPYQFFTKLEKAWTHNGTDKRTWGHLLPVYLAGRAQAAFAQVDLASLDDYEAVKATMLESLGDTPASADRKWWTLSRQEGEEAGAFYLRVRATGIRRLHGLHSREEICEKVILSRYMSLLPPDCYACVATKQPKNGIEAAKMVQEFEETRSFSRRWQPRRQDSNYYHSPSRREQGSGGGVSSSGSVALEDCGVVPGDSEGVAKLGEPSCARGCSQVNNSFGNQNSDMTGSSVKYEKRTPITCYGCGELGHIKPNCPNKIRSVLSSESKNDMLVDGWISGSKVSGLRVDTGAERTIVRSDFVPDSAYLNKSVILDSWRGKQFSKHRVARLLIKVGEREAVVEAAVVDRLVCPALLGNDLGMPMTVHLLSMLLEKVKEEEAEEEKVYSVRMTRAHEIIDEKKDREDVLASVRSEAKPVLLEDIFYFSDSLFEQDPLPTLVEECSPVPVVCGLDIPLPEEVVVQHDPLPLSEIFDFPDSFFEVDPGGSEISLPVEVEEVCKIPLPDEAVGLKVQESVADVRLVQNEAVYSVPLTKATRETSPDRVHFCYFMFVVFLYVILAWCVVFSLFLLNAEVILFTDVSDAGRPTVLWNLKEMPKEFSGLLTLRKEQTDFFLSDFYHGRLKMKILTWTFGQVEGGGDVMRASLLTCDPAVELLMNIN